MQKALKLITNKNIDPLLLSRTVGKKLAYKNENVMQCFLFKKIEKRRKSQIDVGVRVQYAIILPMTAAGKQRLRKKGEKIVTLGEELDFITNQKLKIDRQYYVEKQLGNKMDIYLVKTNLINENIVGKLLQDAMNQIMIQDDNLKTLDSFFIKN